MSESPGGEATVWDRVRSQLSLWEARSDARQASSAAVAEKLARRSQTFRERVRNPQAAGPVVPVIFFSTNRARYGLPLESVVEVQTLESFSPVPGAPDYVHGVVHFRGTILSLVSLAKLFGISESGIIDIHFYIVAQSHGRRVAIAAGDVEDLLDVPVSEIKPAPEWSGRTPQNWVRGVYQNDRLILQLDAILDDDIVAHWRGRT